MIDNELVLALVPVVIGLVQAAKALRVPDALAPLVTVLFGVAAAALWGDGPWRDLSLTGVIVGLTAAGLYSGVTSTRSAIHIRRVTRSKSTPTG